LKVIKKGVSLINRNRCGEARNEIIWILISLVDSRIKEWIGSRVKEKWRNRIRIAEIHQELHESFWIAELCTGNGNQIVRSWEYDRLIVRIRSAFKEGNLNIGERFKFVEKPKRTSTANS
jgi:hypothetical protein